MGKKNEKSIGLIMNEPINHPALADPQSLEKSELRYRRLFEAAQDGILILDAATGAILDINPFLIHMLGFSHEEMVDRKLWEAGAFEDIKASKEAFRTLQKNEYIRYKDLPLRTKAGKLIQVEFISNVYAEGNGKVIQCNIRDISERKQEQDELLKDHALLHEMSIRDHLTGVFNRRYMEETLERELKRAMRQKNPVGAIMLDVDHFRQYNNNFGHAAGDLILCEVGKLLTEEVRTGDVSSRIGGDEFIVLLPEATKDVTHKRAEFLREQVRQFDIQFEGHSLEGITISGGVAAFPADGMTGTAMLKAADDALYRAKQEGRDRIFVANYL
jgi:diguanylate cyclase (GGDEF)-like protein/PAS domain S-box-containing protein